MELPISLYQLTSVQITGLIDLDSLSKFSNEMYVWFSRIRFS
jgi:hypothetical protein